MIINPTNVRKVLKRTTPSIYKKKKIKVKGFVDRIANGIVVVVIRDPDDSEATREVYIPVGKFAKNVPEEGDYVSVTIEVAC